MAQPFRPEIRELPIATLKPAPYNPRRIDDAAIAALTKSLERFGYVEPVIWNQRSGFVVGGHQRLKVLKAKGVESVPVVVVDLDDTEEKALNVALNSPHLAGQFTDDLQKLLDEIQIGAPALMEELRLDELGFIDVDASWQGMPEFQVEDQGAFDSVTVNFADAAARDRFFELLGQPYKKRTWFPPVENVPLMDKRYVGSEE